MNGWWLEARMGERVARPVDATTLNNTDCMAMARAIVGFTTDPLVAFKWIRGEMDRIGPHDLRNGMVDTRFFTTKFLEYPAPTVE